MAQSQHDRKIVYRNVKHQTNQTKIRKEDLKTWGITLGLKTEGDTQGFQCILRDLINNDNRGIKHDFYSLTFARSRGKC